MSRVTGSVITVQRMSGPVLYIKARDRNGKQIKKRLGPLRAGKARRLPGTWTVKEAQDELRDFLTELGQIPDGPGEDVTFRHAVASWLHYVEHDRKRRPSTVRDYRIAAEHHLIPEFGDRPLRDITTDDIDDYRERLVAAGQLSDRTINKLLTMMHGDLQTRPAASTSLPTNPVAGRGAPAGACARRHHRPRPRGRPDPRAARQERAGRGRVPHRGVHRAAARRAPRAQVAGRRLRQAARARPLVLRRTA